MRKTAAEIQRRPEALRGVNHHSPLIKGVAKPQKIQGCSCMMGSDEDSYRILNRLADLQKRTTTGLLICLYTGPVSQTRQVTVFGTIERRIP